MIACFTILISKVYARLYLSTIIFYLHSFSSAVVAVTVEELDSFCFSSSSSTTSKVFNQFLTFDYVMPSRLILLSRLYIKNMRERIPIKDSQHWIIWLVNLSTKFWNILHFKTYNNLSKTVLTNVYTNQEVYYSVNLVFYN